MADDARESAAERLPADASGGIGAPDAGELLKIRDLLLAEEPLVVDASLDDLLTPQAVHVAFADGIGDATWCRLEATWYTSGAYRFHYVDGNDVNWRFDRHPNPHAPEKHFHRPPEADSETAIHSCIEVAEPRLVTRAVMKLWRRAYDTGSLSELNDARNPP